MLNLFLTEGKQYGGIRMTEADAIATRAELLRRRVLKALLG